MPRRLEILIFDDQQTAVAKAAQMHAAGLHPDIDGPFVEAEVAVRVDNLKSRVKRLDGKTIWRIITQNDIV